MKAAKPTDPGRLPSLPSQCSAGPVAGDIPVVGDTPLVGPGDWAIFQFGREHPVRWICLVAVGVMLLQLPLAKISLGQETGPLNAAQKGDSEAFFEAQVRPLMVTHCIDCHGPDDQSGELRLDRKTDFIRGGGLGPVVVAGDPQKSLLVRAIGYQDNALQMPPDNKLPTEAIAVLTEWVRRGAHWPDEPENGEPAQGEAVKGEAVKQASMGDAGLTMPAKIVAQRETHWSYHPIDRPHLPSLESIVAKASENHAGFSAGQAAARTPVDLFVRQQLADAGLAPSPSADRRTLIQRAYFTLLGLPPTHEEVREFEQDRHPDAFARLVDRLLANPRYGERWARHWLDLARYGDTMGYLAGSREERYPFAFTYRDYVIDAFNEDKPFDRFVLEQLAADQLELPGEQRRSLAAMGYLTVGRRFMNRQHDIIDDQIDVVTRGFLGLSVSCARCHDHKYDPIPTADYYSLYGVFASSREPDELPLLGEPQTSPQYQAFLEATAAKQNEVDQWLEQRRVETEQELRSRVGDYLVYTTEQLPAYRREDQKQFQGRRGPLRPAAVRNWEQFLVDAARANPTWKLFRELALLPAESFVKQAPEMIETAALGAADRPALPARLHTALVEGKPQSMIDAAAIFGNVFEAVHQEWTEAQAGEDPPQQLADADSEQLRQLLWDAAAPTSLDQPAMVAHLDQAQRNTHNQLINDVNGVEVTHPGAPPRGMVLVDKPQPVEPVIFRRGEPSNRGDQVPRRFLQVLAHVDGGQPFEQGSGRLELARAITDPQNPLTARVIVNRIWQHHFGEGLVRTPSDFGVRGEAPTHPQMLDYLASELIDSGWSIKHVQRLIMLSDTWRQSSEIRPAADRADPENRLLWHMPRQRLEFEALRDRLLVTAERLDGRIGGRSVMIHEDSPRRGLYAYIDREDFPGLLASFDVPSPDASRAKRAETTVPQQALFLMNSKFVIEQARALASACENTESDSIADSQAANNAAVKNAAINRIRDMFRRTLVRTPRPWELESALAFVSSEAPGNSGEAPGNRDISNSPADGDTVVDPWVQLAQVLLLSNEFCFVD